MVRFDFWNKDGTDYDQQVYDAVCDLLEKTGVKTADIVYSGGRFHFMIGSDRFQVRTLKEVDYLWTVL